VDAEDMRQRGNHAACFPPEEMVAEFHD